MKPGYAGGFLELNGLNCRHERGEDLEFKPDMEEMRERGNLISANYSLSRYLPFWKLQALELFFGNSKDVRGGG